MRLTVVYKTKYDDYNYVKNQDTAILQQHCKQKDITDSIQLNIFYLFTPSLFFGERWSWRNQFRDSVNQQKYIYNNSSTV